MSNEAQELEDIFNDDDTTESTESTEESEEVSEESSDTASQAASESEDSTDESESTAEPEVKAPAALKESDNDEQSWTKSAVLDERRKRQALEAELESLRKPKEVEKAPDVFDDPDKYTSYVGNQINKGITEAKLSMSQEFMRMQDPEYDEKEAEFIDMAKDNPQLSQQLIAHPMPAKFVVDHVNKSRELKKLENIDDYKATLRAEMEAELRKEIEAEVLAKKEGDETVSSIRPSLAKARASKEQGDPLNDSLEDLFDS